MRKSHPNHHTSLDSGFSSPERPAELYQVAAMAIYHGGSPMGLFEQPHMKEFMRTLHPVFADKMAGRFGFRKSLLEKAYQVIKNKV